MNYSVIPATRDQMLVLTIFVLILGLVAIFALVEILKSVRVIAASLREERPEE